MAECTIVREPCSGVLNKTLFINGIYDVVEFSNKSVSTTPGWHANASTL